MSDFNQLPQFCNQPVVILGCGNIFFGDDAFGCVVVDYIEAHGGAPDSVCLLDAGTGVRNLLFTITLSPVKPRRLLILDAVDVGRAPGELFELDPADIPAVKIDDFSMHQMPTSNLLRELQEQCGLEVRILACQTGPLPDQVAPGLSAPVERAIAEAADWIAREYFGAVYQGTASAVPIEPQKEEGASAPAARHREGR
jgi:coenzyme F420 hydrogenase subunit delta